MIPDFYSRPHLSYVWALVLGLPLPAPIPLKFKVPPRGRESLTSFSQRLFDGWHGLEDGIEHQPRGVQLRRLHWMARMEGWHRANGILMESPQSADGQLLAAGFASLALQYKQSGDEAQAERYARIAKRLLVSAGI